MQTSLLPLALLCLRLCLVTPLKIWLQYLKNSIFRCPCTSAVHLQVVPVADPHIILTIAVYFTVLTGVYIKNRIPSLHTNIPSSRAIHICVLYMNKNLSTNVSRNYRMDVFIEVIWTVQLQATVVENEKCQSNKPVSCHCFREQDLLVDTI
jgi:hypothetical protein